MERTRIHSSPASEKTGKNSFGLQIVVVGLFAVLLALGSLLFVRYSVSEKKAEVIENVEQRLGVVAHSRAEIFNAWLKELSHRGDRLIKSDLFRLYASEVDAIEGDLAAFFGARGMNPDEPGAELVEQLPMMQNMLREFCTYSGFISARILNREGQAYLASDGHLPPMSKENRLRATKAIKDKAPSFSSLRNSDQGLAMDIFVPVYPPEAAKNDKPVAVLMLTRQVTGKITELLSNSPLSAQGERTRLMQKENGDFREVRPWTTEGFSKVVFNPSKNLTDNGNLSFKLRPTLSKSEDEVYSLGIKLNGPNWWIVQEIDREAASTPIDAFSNTIYSITGLIFLTIMLSAGLAWWVRAGVNSRRSALKFKQLAKRIDEQKRLLDSINANIQEFITLKNLSGKYIYVNQAFANAVGRKESEVIGMDTEAVFGFDTARRLNSVDEAVYDENDRMVVNEVIYFQSRKHNFQISKSPFHDKDGNCMGIVEVFRDITELIAAQEKNQRLIRHTLEAFGSTIKAADPYLGGHTKLMSALAHEVGKSMNLPEMDVAELETAANLSQIGKMFIPKDILTKPDRLTEEEKEIMETHVDYAHRILKDIGIDQNVLKTIYQMNERLDGSGYPQKLSGEAISQQSRILSVLNAFCAMIRPRSYRGAKTPREALGILSEMGNKYDSSIIEALSRTLDTPAGEKIVEKAD